MNKLKIKGNWNKTAGKFKKNYAILTGNELLFSEGKKEEILGEHQKTLGGMTEEIHHLFTKVHFSKL